MCIGAIRSKQTNLKRLSKMNHKLNILGTLVFMSLLFSAESHAAIYKCVKANSEVFYNDKPCPVADKETEFNSVKDPENGYIPPAFVEDNTQSGTTTKLKSVVVGDTTDDDDDSLSNAQALDQGNTNGQGAQSNSQTDSSNDISDLANQDVLDYSLIENGQISLDDIKIDKSLKLNIVNSEPMN